MCNWLYLTVNLITENMKLITEILAKYEATNQQSYASRRLYEMQEDMVFILF
jgi:hypothetical protein